MHTIRFVSVFFFGVALSTVSCAQSGPLVLPLTGADLKRLIGRWYAIASIPTCFEGGGHKPVETYRQVADGTVCNWFWQRPENFTDPVNLIYSSTSILTGSSNGEWVVCFFGFLHAQYLTGSLSPNHAQVMAVRSARDHLWYMAREPDVSDSDDRAMLGRATAIGCGVSAMGKTPQGWPESGPGDDTLEGNCP